MRGGGRELDLLEDLCTCGGRWWSLKLWTATVRVIRTADVRVLGNSWHSKADGLFNLDWRNAGSLVVDHRKSGGRGNDKEQGRSDSGEVVHDWGLTRKLLCCGGDKMIYSIENEILVLGEERKRCQTVKRKSQVDFFR